MPQLNKRGRQTRKSGTIAERVRKVRDKETPQEQLLRQQHDRERNMLRLRVLTPKSKGKRLREMRDRTRFHLKKETPTGRRARLRDLVERQGSRLRVETPT